MDWDDNALISAFRWGLRDDVKDLLLNLPDPITLSEAITQAVVADATLEARLRQDRTCRDDFSYKQQEQDEFITPG